MPGLTNEDEKKAKLEAPMITKPATKLLDIFLISNVGMNHVLYQLSIINSD